MAARLPEAAAQVAAVREVVQGLAAVGPEAVQELATEEAAAAVVVEAAVRVLEGVARPPLLPPSLPGCCHGPGNSREKSPPR